MKKRETIERLCQSLVEVVIFDLFSIVNRVCFKLFSLLLVKLSRTIFSHAHICTFKSVIDHRTILSWSEYAHSFILLFFTSLFVIVFLVLLSFIALS